MFEMLYFMANKSFMSVLFVLMGRQSKTRDPTDTSASKTLFLIVTFECFSGYHILLVIRVAVEAL